jgi:hypothetical protein
MPRCRVLLLRSLLFTALLMAELACAEVSIAPSVLLRLASQLQAEPEAERADFAAVALGEMISAFEFEFEQLSVPGQVSGAEIAKQARWGHAFQRFLDELYAARDELDAGALVEVLIAPPAALQLMIGERLVAVVSPRIEKPQLFEEQIVQAYCASFICDPQLLVPVQAMAAKVGARGGWSFAAGEGSTYETNDGLGFMFTDVRERSRKEQICLQVGAELNLLSNVLAAAQQHGTTVDMSALRVATSQRGDDQLVVLSASGHTVRANLPALAEAPALVVLARAWLAARSDGKRYQQRFPRAERLMAKLLSHR